MSKSHDSRLSLDTARQLLREAGLRCTSCRVAVIQFLSGADCPMSHAEVAEDLVPRGFDKSTIYRCLMEFADAGLVNRLDVGDHVWRFERRTAHDEQGVEHPHFMCVDCGQVTCLNDVNVRVAQKRGQKPLVLGDVTEVLLKGHCPQCQ